MTPILNVIACNRHINKETKGTDAYHLLGWLLRVFSLLSALPFMVNGHTWLDTISLPGDLFGPAKILKPELP